MNKPIEPVAPATPERLPLPGEIHDPQIPVQPEVREPSSKPLQDDPPDIHLDAAANEDMDAAEEQEQS